VLREIIGNPFRAPGTVDDALLGWKERTVPKLAQSESRKERALL
jgi:hypothetical protein